MTGKNLEAANHVGQAPQIEIRQTAIGEAPTTLSAAPISVDIYRFPAVQTAP
jgi:alpha-L-arabinofuranosidase